MTRERDNTGSSSVVGGASEEGIHLIHHHPSIPPPGVRSGPACPSSANTALVGSTRYHHPPRDAAFRTQRSARTVTSLQEACLLKKCGEMLCMHWHARQCAGWGSELT